VQKLLVVDDDQQIREIISHFLTIQGYHVAQADNGTQALKKCFEENIDVVVTDFQMPGMNGLSLTHHIHSVVPETPVIVMSGDGSIGKNKALNVGAADFIQKPFVIQEVLAKIRMVLTTET
jgi:DNA-binding NtrC family response regulator